MEIIGERWYVMHTFAEKPVTFTVSMLTFAAGFFIIFVVSSP